MLEEAASSHGVSSAICRVGQLGGPIEKNGVWSKQEWLPSVSRRSPPFLPAQKKKKKKETDTPHQLIASSKYLHKIPTTLPSQDAVPWVPVDFTARIIGELLFADIDDPASSSEAWTRHHNIVNPTPGSWAELIPTITTHLGGNIQAVAFGDWIDALRASA
ncbi:MAG: hypothetical protein Q9195_009552, partial [Heterodermia aff. obscurata]